MPDMFTFVKHKNLKQRLKSFVGDLRKWHFSFLTAYDFMTSLLSSQSGQLSFAQMDVAHVFKYESLQSEYRDMLHDGEERFCVDESDHFVLREDVGDAEWAAMRMSLGVERAWLERRELREWMGLPTEVAYAEVAQLERMDVLYVYDAMDYDVYSKLVEFYWQDFVCFDYAADYRSDVLQPLVLYQEEFAGFPVKNRTKTNWDRILEYWHSKHPE